MQSSDVSLCESSLNSLSLFQLALQAFTSSPSVSLSVLHALSTASHMRKPPPSVCARQITPGLLQTHHLPPAHVRLCLSARHSVCLCVCPGTPSVLQCPGPACSVCSPWGDAALGRGCRGWRGCPYNPDWGGRCAVRLTDSLINWGTVI